MLPYRQVHLDFHTSEAIEGIGKRFSKENFIAALKEGHVNSITVFSKCHHGWAYHPTTVNQQHPHLDFDLLDAQLSACEEAGVRAEVYISAGFDEKYARAHSECLRTKKDGSDGGFLEPKYHRLCFGTPYLQQLEAEVDEVMRLYGKRVQGVFLDIVTAGRCYCQYCLAGMRAQGLDPANDDDAQKYADQVYQNYAETMRCTVAKYDPDMPLIHNDGGAIFQGHEVVDHNNGHLELESLPTGGWGYDHFPLSAAYARTFGKEFLGMTGKFHGSWGEFGGFKHPNALRYEAALANACGARCSVGDQLHPDGEMDLATYRLIGAAYKEVEAREPWLTNAEAVADIGLLTVEKCIRHKEDALVGANRMLLEGHYLYNVIDSDADFSAYRLLILPDTVILKGELREKVNTYLKNGGKLLLSGLSGTDGEGNFAVPTGFAFCGKSALCPSYLRPEFDLAPNGQTAYVMYSDSFCVEPADPALQITASRLDAYFNRTAAHFCSHRHTPYDRERVSAGVGILGNIAYIGWNVFEEYAVKGSLHLRAIVTDTLDRLLGAEKTLTTDLPSGGVTALMKQHTQAGERLVHHLTYAVTKCRGKGVEIIEDLPDISHVHCSVRSCKNPTRVYAAPGMREIPFTYEDGKVTYTVPAFRCGTMIVLEF
ncbi:MAG: beta-galactosidase trimerization domain-containing protein [Clostridia bacterium]|nr:beta-galactosidase trimerization domain-containing protein [Clostridia bacterium]